MRLRTEQHLRHQRDIRGVREEGRRIECRVFTVWWRRREAPGNDPAPTGDSALAIWKKPVPPRARVCVVASTNAVGAAHRRNRAKRRLREIFRQHQDLVPADCDVLLIARAAVLNSTYPELERKFAEACSQISPPGKNA
jgi:ribonuclease P protein component